MATAKSFKADVSSVSPSSDEYIFRMQRSCLDIGWISKRARWYPGGGIGGHQTLAGFWQDHSRIPEGLPSEKEVQTNKRQYICFFLTNYHMVI